MMYLLVILTEMNKGDENGNFTNLNERMFVFHNRAVNIKKIFHTRTGRKVRGIRVFVFFYVTLVRPCIVPVANVSKQFAHNSFGMYHYANNKKMH